MFFWISCILADSSLCFALVPARTAAASAVAMQSGNPTAPSASPDSTERISRAPRGTLRFDGSKPDGILVELIAETSR